MVFSYNGTLLDLKNNKPLIHKTVWMNLTNRPTRETGHERLHVGVADVIRNIPWVPAVLTSLSRIQLPLRNLGESRWQLRHLSSCHPPRVSQWNSWSQLWLLCTFGEWTNGRKTSTLPSTQNSAFQTNESENIKGCIFNDSIYIWSLNLTKLIQNKRKLRKQLSVAAGSISQKREGTAQGRCTCEALYKDVDSAVRVLENTQPLFSLKWICFIIIKFHFKNLSAIMYSTICLSNVTS